MLLPKNNQRGFTLIEILLVLTVLSVITSVSFLQLKPVVEAKKIQSFFQTLENDLLFAQNYAMSHSESVYVYFMDHEFHYKVLVGSSKREVLRRNYSNNITIPYNNLTHGVIYLSNGNLSKSGTILFDIKGEVYKITFLLGKGRFYVTQV
ncbi:type II secretion system protein [Cytobacillus suaedae]|nr:type II secretion system protein [Cytobacillus suaedae]